MRKWLSYILIPFLACFSVPLEEQHPQNEPLFCDYDIDGICVTEGSRLMNVDPETISWVVGLVEEEVNSHFTGLDLSSLAEKNELKLKYRWATASTQYSGIYTDREIRIYLRRGSNITPLMQCQDKYVIAGHELLHFIVDYHLHVGGFTSQEEAHMVPHMFILWTIKEGLSVDQSVEGRVYTRIWLHCSEQ